MDIPKKTAGRILKIIEESDNICIFSHRNPDCDTVGSNLAMRMVIESMGKNAVSVCIDDIPPECQLFNGKSYFSKDFNPKITDLFISVDAGSEDQIKFPTVYPAIMKKPFINIDHHPSNTNFGEINLVVPEAASTTMIIFELLGLWEIPITPDIATALLAGIYSDTGSFMHSNTTDEVYATAANLMGLGADRQMIITKIFKNNSLQKLKLLGKILSEAQLTDKNIIVSAIRDKDFADSEAVQTDLGGAIDYLNMVKNSRLAALISEDGNGNVRGSLRTKRDDLNVSDIAMNLGGGGHKKASGFTIKGRLEKNIRWSIK